MDWWERRQSTSLRPLSVSFQSKSFDCNHCSTELDQRTASNCTLNNFPEQPKACLDEALLSLDQHDHVDGTHVAEWSKRVRSFSSLWKFDELELYLPLQPISPLPGLIGFGVDEDLSEVIRSVQVKFSRRVSTIRLSSVTRRVVIDRP